MLYIVSTPIGHLEDLSPRALKTLAKVSVVACEDTRHTQKLLTHHGVQKPLVRYDEHVHHREMPRLLERLQRNEDVALVTDAGTPGVSDPGARLIQAAVAAGIPVVPVPGPSAVLAALVGSGLPTDRFTFLGFLPRRPGPLKRAFEEAGADRTLVFFESVFRIRKTLEAALQVFGDAPAVVARELTKVHEEFLRGSLSQVLETLAQRGELKGELTAVVAPQLLKGARSEAREAGEENHEI
jgi:16S rRNA (cytidine1402-2'-O)-methyltransferase